jgi:hypothetical protein
VPSSRGIKEINMEEKEQKDTGKKEPSEVKEEGNAWFEKRFKDNPAYKKPEPTKPR